MWKKIHGAFGALVLGAASLSGALAANPTPKVAPTVFTAQSGAIAVVHGQTFLIALDANPTTGYSWSAVPGFDTNLIAVEGSSFRGPGEPLPGAGGTQIFVLRARAPGTTTLALGYARPFEKGVAPVRRAKFSIAVR